MHKKWVKWSLWWSHKCKRMKNCERKISLLVYCDVNSIHATFSIGHNNITRNDIWEFGRPMPKATHSFMLGIFHRKWISQMRSFFSSFFIVIRFFIQFLYFNASFVLAVCRSIIQHEHTMEIWPSHCNDEILRSGHKREPIRWRQNTSSTFRFFFQRRERTVWDQKEFSIFGWKFNMALFIKEP